VENLARANAGTDLSWRTIGTTPGVIPLSFVAGVSDDEIFRYVLAERKPGFNTYFRSKYVRFSCREKKSEFHKTSLLHFVSVMLSYALFNPFIRDRECICESILATHYRRR
jgi:hypothetical protein